MKHTQALWFVAALAAYGISACGGGHAEPHEPGGPPGGHAEHHEMKGPVGELHAVLAPVWHDKSAADRNTKACDQAATMKERSAAVDAATPPDAAKADAYKAASKDLVTSADALVAACAADGRPEVEAKLTAFHDAFHKVMEATPDKHDEHHDGPPPGAPPGDKPADAPKP